MSPFWYGEATESKVAVLALAVTASAGGWKFEVEGRIPNLRDAGSAVDPKTWRHLLLTLPPPT